LKKLGRNAVLAADAEYPLYERIVRLQQFDFGLTLNYIRKFVFKMCKEHNIKNPWKGRMVGEVWFAL
jgi:hypothetical protein